MMDLSLPRVDHVEDGMWLAIEASHGRLLRAIEANDRSQAIGSAKELIECIAKVVVTTRGEVVEAAIDFPSLISRAHKCLERQPGEGLTASDPLRAIAQGAKTIASQFAQLRNEMGTGHGRPYEPEIEDEAYHVGMEATMLWARWALRRLSSLAYGLPDALVRDLRRATFYSGDIARRLKAADLANQPTSEQRRVGVAIGQRAMRETYLARLDGVEACAQSDSLTDWPSSYRFGVLNGLFFDEQGRLTCTEWMSKTVANLVIPIPELQDELRGLRDRVKSSEGPSLDWGVQYNIFNALVEAANRFPDGVRPLWMDLARRFDPTPF